MSVLKVFRDQSEEYVEAKNDFFVNELGSYQILVSIVLSCCPRTFVFLALSCLSSEGAKYLLKTGLKILAVFSPCLYEKITLNGFPK